jgi:hypothetical protein
VGGRLWGLAVLASCPGLLVAQPISREALPPELRAWVPWVLDEVPTYGCPMVEGQAVCAWPGRLRLDLGSGGGRFDMEVRADRATEMRLPGDGQRWPVDLTVDGQAAPAVERDGAPILRLQAGRHRVTGRFEWPDLPESLPVPPSIGLVELSLDGRTVAGPRRQGDGLLWLRARQDPASGVESLRLQVFRKISDGVPPFVETRLDLEVSGRAREVRLPRALLPGTVPVSVSGDLPARLEPDGSLRVQVRGGRFSVTYVSRLEASPASLPLPERDADLWPASEVWVFQADEPLRQLDVSGAPGIDPSRTELPEEWRALPAFLMEKGAALAFAERRRGQPEAPPDRLTLTRELWLDPSGGGFSVRDTFGGRLHGTARLDLLSPAELGRAVLDGREQLVTQGRDGASRGIEVRRRRLSLVADARLPRAWSERAVGWSSGAEQLRAQLNVPPGWSLLGASGVDSVPGTWVSRWNLLGFFFVLLVTIGVHRLFGRWPAVVALLALVLTYGEPRAPFLVWLSLLGAFALRRVAPGQRLQAVARLWWLVSVVTLVLVLVPFARDQIKHALFPQVEPVAFGGGVLGGAVGGVLDEQKNAQLRELGHVATEGAPAAGAVAPAAPPPPAAATPPPQEAPGAAGRARVMRRPEAAQDTIASLEEQVEVKGEYERGKSYGYDVFQQDPKAVVQTGPGMPSWRWRQYSLSWSGPVGPEHRMRLFLASPGLNRLLTLLRLTLSGLLAALLLNGGRFPPLPFGELGTTQAASAATLLLFALSLGAPRGAAAQSVPGPELLQDVKRRLTRPEPCGQVCIETPRLHLQISGDELRLVIEVHAQADATFRVPGPLGSWVPASVTVDGVAAGLAAHQADAFLHVRLSPGVHRVEARGPVPPGDSFTLELADRPRQARAEATGWDVSGLRRDGPPDASLQVTRRLPAGGRGAQASGAYAPWLQVRRTMSLGIAWRVTTEVVRLSPPGAPLALRVPLLEGEAPSDGSLTVEDGAVTVSLGRDQMDASWSSTLKPVDALTLTAPKDRSWSEVWRVQCGLAWDCTAEGLAPVGRESDDVLEPQYRPWPGETVVLRLRRPGAVEGQTLTLDRVDLESAPGARLERASLRLSARSSREQALVITLPEGVELQELTVDGAPRSSRPEKGRLSVTVPAGAHAVALRWQQERGLGLFYSLPRVGLSAPAANLSLKLELPPERWLLFTRGPTWGPAVLFWPYLVFLMASAWVLGRLPGSPLTSLQWLLLGLGLSQIPALGALFVAAFFFALAWRQKRPFSSALAFDVGQLALLLGAVVTVVLLYTAIQTGLLFRPDMQVAGQGSTDTVLRWYADRVAETTPSAGVVSLPLWSYRVLMLAWALWLATRLVGWAGWAWRSFSDGGVWKRIALPARKASVAASPVADEQKP